jgi:hypothetical protein
MPPKKRAATAAKAKAKATPAKRKAPVAKNGMSIDLFDYLIIFSVNLFSSCIEKNKKTS